MEICGVISIKFLKSVSKQDMKKKVKALLESEKSSGNKELDRLKKTLETAGLKFEKAKAAKADAKEAFNKFATQWLEKAKTSPKKKEKGKSSPKASKAKGAGI